ncbi:MAG: DUF192 domain-containing protein [Patescibacteria group bacterium]
MDQSQQQQSSFKSLFVFLIATLVIIGIGYGGYTVFLRKNDRSGIPGANKEQPANTQIVKQETPSIKVIQKKQDEKNQKIQQQNALPEEEQEIPVIPQPILNPERATTPSPVRGASVPTPTLYPMTIKATAISVELAETRDQQEHGLGGRTGLAEDRGLLYILRKPDFYTFWMKDMKFPIDIIWIDKDQKVIDISHSLTPDTYPRIFQPVHPAQIILEVASGFAKKHDIKIGDPVSVPKIQQ